MCHTMVTAFYRRPSAQLRVVVTLNVCSRLFMVKTDKRRKYTRTIWQLFCGCVRIIRYYRHRWSHDRCATASWPSCLIIVSLCYWKAVSMIGVGWAMLFVSFLVSIYYNIIIAYILRYLFASFTSTLPWQSCKPEWIELGCYERDVADDGKYNCTPPARKMIRFAQKLFQ